MNGGDVTEEECAIIYVRSWVVVHSEDAAAVARSMRVVAARDCAVQQGLDETARDRRKCFVAPPTGGWTLVFGADLAFDDALVSRLSREYGETQAFHCDAKHYGYSWTRSRSGAVVRAAGVFDGEASSEGTAAPPEPDDLDDADELDVLRIARAWSVDPNALLRSTAAGQLGDRG
jgi:hypothetical protein